jgi:hypothetical protein
MKIINQKWWSERLTSLMIITLAFLTKSKVIINVFAFELSEMNDKVNKFIINLFISSIKLVSKSFSE